MFTQSVFVVTALVQQTVFGTTEFVIEGDPNATNFDLSNIVSASLAFGDGQWTDLESFSLERNPLTGEVTGLTYGFGAIDTQTVLMGISLNFPLTITGTDIATGQEFEYRYATSAPTLTAVPEPSSFVLLAFGGLAIGGGICFRRSRCARS